jgi:CheY-like chemotaxis protein
VDRLDRDLAERIQQAYQHLYDLAYLSTQDDLLDLLVPESRLTRRERAWRLHHLLLDVIEETSPGAHAPTLSPEWRRYRLMVLRFVNGQDVDAVANELCISRRQFYRDLEAAVAAIATLLLRNTMPCGTGSELISPETSSAEVTTRLEILRREATSLSHQERLVPVMDVVARAAQVVAAMAANKGVSIALSPSQSTGICSNSGLLRQTLLGLLSFFLDCLADGTIQIDVSDLGSRVQICIRMSASASGACPAGRAGMANRVASLQELADLLPATLHLNAQQGAIVGCDLTLAEAAPRTVLIVDDNPDVLQLMERYLMMGGYQAIKAETSAEALRLSRTTLPYAIILDLMMPGQDGWDILQTLTTQPETQHIPILVSSVLDAKELALSLGAAGFLAKPVSAQTLIATLDALSAP